jgi:hypothetical protein
MGFGTHGPWMRGQPYSQQSSISAVRAGLRRSCLKRPIKINPVFEVSQTVGNSRERPPTSAVSICRMGVFHARFQALPGEKTHLCTSVPAHHLQERRRMAFLRPA